jgi:hypothetical protein
MPTLREVVEQALIDNVPEVQGRVYEPEVPTSDTQKPYLTVREGIDAFNDWWIPNTTQIEVTPVVDQNTFVDVDNLRREIRAALNGLVAVVDIPQTPPAPDIVERYQLWFDGGVRPDTQDSTLLALQRGERYTVINLGLLRPSGIVPDPAASAASFIADVFPPDVVQTDVTTWAPSDTNPGVYFRVESTTDTEKWNTVQWRTGVLVGHVLAVTPAAMWQWVAAVRDKLSSESFICMDNGRKMYIQPGLVVNFSANPWRQGQIRIPIRYGVDRTSAYQPVPAPVTITTIQTSPTEGTVPQIVVPAA